MCRRREAVVIVLSCSAADVQVVECLASVLSASVPSVAKEDVDIVAVTNTGKSGLGTLRNLYETANTDVMDKVYEAEVRVRVR
jgi:hypothetical protein